MNILLTNDDGIQSPGLIKLAMELQKKHNVYIVAPDSEQSAKSQAITIRQDMVLKRLDIEGINNPAYALAGTPADCVRVGLEVLYREGIDLIFSGCNFGLNVGADILYSGTVSACVEGNIYKLPGVAVSAEVYEGEVDFDKSAKLAVGVFEKYRERLMDKQIVLNVNIPRHDEHDIKGVIVCEVGEAIFDSYISEETENGQMVIKSNGRKLREYIRGSDRYYIDEGYVAVSPISYKFNDPELLAEFKR